jgi:hypothetical protein
VQQLIEGSRIASIVASALLQLQVALDAKMKWPVGAGGIAALATGGFKLEQTTRGTPDENHPTVRHLEAAVVVASGCI